MFYSITHLPKNIDVARERNHFYGSSAEFVWIFVSSPLRGCAVFAMVKRADGIK